MKIYIFCTIYLFSSFTWSHQTQLGPFTRAWWPTSHKPVTNPAQLIAPWALGQHSIFAYYKILEAVIFRVCASSALFLSQLPSLSYPKMVPSLSRILLISTFTLWVFIIFFNFHYGFVVDSKVSSMDLEIKWWFLFHWLVWSYDFFYSYIFVYWVLFFLRKSSKNKNGSAAVVFTLFPFLHFSRLPNRLV